MDKKDIRKAEGEEELFIASVLKTVKELDETVRVRPVIIAIDGKSASGKSTLAERIHKALGGNLFHMDDFFLRPGQRTEKRLSEVGGNVDYERFSEVLAKIRTGRDIDYQAFDCKRKCLEPSIRMRSAHLNIVEGSYSQHPSFFDCYDLRIVLDIEENEQQNRIRIRNGEEMLTRFTEEWIPKENAYLNTFFIFEKGDIIRKVQESYDPAAFLPKNYKK